MNEQFITPEGIEVDIAQHWESGVDIFVVIRRVNGMVHMRHKKTGVIESIPVQQIVHNHWSQARSWRLIEEATIIAKEVTA